MRLHCAHTMCKSSILLSTLDAAERFTASSALPSYNSLEPILSNDGRDSKCCSYCPSPKESMTILLSCNAFHWPFSFVHTKHSPAWRRELCGSSTVLATEQATMQHKRANAHRMILNAPCSLSLMANVHSSRCGRVRRSPRSPGSCVPQDNSIMVQHPDQGAAGPVSFQIGWSSVDLWVFLQFLPSCW